ncbi:MAG: YbaN family protein [Spirochaetaceae bacterium]|nr:YbaN family protein [Spirochaetaceae bacterium]
MNVSRVLFIVLGMLLLALGLIGVVIPVLPTTPFVLAASFCFLKSSPRLYRWIMTHRFFGPRIERFRSVGLTKKEKVSIFLMVCALLTPVFIFSHSLHLRIFLALLLVVKAIVFMRIKTAPGPGKQQKPVDLDAA